MTNLFTTLEMRSHLKAYMKRDMVVVFLIQGCEPLFAKVNRIGWFTVALDVVDMDEETWLATEVIPIKDIFGINEQSIERSRVQFMRANGELDDMDQCKSSVFYGEDDDEYEDDEDDC